MSLRASVFIAIVVGSLLVAPALAFTGGGSPAQASTSADSETAVSAVGGNNTTAENDSSPSLGSQMSAFMQSNAVETNASVDTGMWAASVRGNASEANRSVANRIWTLERRLDRLQTRLDRFENGSTDIAGPSRAARIARLGARIQALQSAINETDRVAEQVGVNATRLESLRTQAANMSGREIASMARKLSAGPPDRVPTGPPDNDQQGPPNGTAGPPSDDQQEPPNGTAGPANGDTETDRKANGSVDSPADGETGPPGTETASPSDDRDGNEKTEQGSTGEGLDSDDTPAGPDERKTEQTK
jgi:hypothetical protein